ncbi:hypothetical protein [Phytoactinopolyspora endophytica]|uniref:hypothetical protein n=1 Tax=Phytoactinopolyspora endophytica TaxID=1642495 RepID=UPI00101B8E84|nr:hypothetical protein [Phytoactinopolyspora endophytica]
MSIRITDESMTSDITRHEALRVYGDVWGVSWLPGRQLDRNQAITAMTLAETVTVAVNADGPVCTDTIRTLIDTWASELGLTGPGALTRVVTER